MSDQVKNCRSSLPDLTATLQNHTSARYTSPKNGTEQRGADGLQFMATPLPIHVPWENFIQNLPVMVLYASSTKNIILFYHYEIQINFCQWNTVCILLWSPIEICLKSGVKHRNCQRGNFCLIYMYFSCIPLHSKRADLYWWTGWGQICKE